MLTMALIMAGCGVTGQPATVLARIVEVESGGVPYALNVNGDYELVRHPTGPGEAVAMAKWLYRHGYNFDAGLGQVNSANFARLGLTMEAAFEPCANLRAALTVFEECRARAIERFGAGAASVGAALSCYNTGDFSRGHRNGYVANVLDTRRSHGSGTERAEDDGGRTPTSAARGAALVHERDVFGQGGK